MLNCLDMIVNKFIKLSLRCLIDSCAINRPLDQQDRFATLQAKKIRGILFKLCFCYFKD
jgi:hypothetical protein